MEKKTSIIRITNSDKDLIDQLQMILSVREGRILSKIETLNYIIRIATPSIISQIEEVIE